MSRVGKKPVPIPDGVKISEKQKTGEHRVYEVSGKLGTLELPIDLGFSISTDENTAKVVPGSESGFDRAKYGLYRALLGNAVEGVSSGFTKEIELVGVGYRVQMDGKGLNFSLGYSHPVKFGCPDGISFAIEGNKVKITGVDKVLVGQTTADLKALRQRDPYKGKGVLGVGEQRTPLKAGKTVKK